MYNKNNNQANNINRASKENQSDLGQQYYAKDWKDFWLKKGIHYKS